MTFEGGCYCGQVRYVAEGKPRLMAQCIVANASMSATAPNIKLSRQDPVTLPQRSATPPRAPATITSAINALAVVRQ
jgi:hypothetical protein